MSQLRPIYIATRGSALALAQAGMVAAACREQFPGRRFELKVIKTTGDKLQSISLSTPGTENAKGLFTKELEIALLDGEADFAVHSLKDLPTELPAGLRLAATMKREDPRDVLIFRDETRYTGPGRSFSRIALGDLPEGAVIATSSTRRQAQLLDMGLGLKVVPIRGNVGTRLQKLLNQPELDGTILAMAGLNRLGVEMDAEGRLEGDGIPPGCAAVALGLSEMIPCVGQAALGLESRVDDPELGEILGRLNHTETMQCVTAERAFLQAMGGGCLSPVAAYAWMDNGQLLIHAVSFRDETVRRARAKGAPEQCVALGRRAAMEVGAAPRDSQERET